MEALLALLQEYVASIKADCAVISQNYAAMNTMADEVLEALPPEAIP